jgi:2-polyprenyl-3-methyl-5-hydroxy-6-metoxy-1,4-benzoquinol methylase
MNQNVEVRSLLKRLRPALYLSAGAWGASINFLSTVLCARTYEVDYYLALLLGTVLNGVFNFWFCYTFHLKDAQEGHQVEVSIPSAVAIHGCLYALGVGELMILSSWTTLPIEINVALVIASFSIISLFVGRIWVFVSPFSSAAAYEELDEDFYDSSKQADQVGWFRAWYHSGRFRETSRLVEELYKEGDVIYDFGCGGSEWNQRHLPVHGVDVNEKLLQHGIRAKQLSSYSVAPISESGLPADSADILVLTEVLEHMVSEKEVLAEIRRTLKPGGYLVLSVPFDTIYSIFFWLFNAQCFYRGYVLGEDYYYQRCGHVHHFSRPRLVRLLRQSGFRVLRSYVFRGLLIYSVSERDS